MVSMDCSPTLVLKVLITVSCLLVEVLWFHRYLSYFHYFHNFLTLIFFWLLSASPFFARKKEHDKSTLFSYFSLLNDH